ncbi:sensor domain-containing diguanylate cyclase [uncultured Thiodictyon sp.]|uniref:GGDEF domain-containing protein n=1 Tax=uncultured Thiodictyon sp. TaxID=1846217 RepID=UPI0025DBE060|nr:sensor domain-containing diguanylate cyclase [uncultured Thiodictyon sp.]
MSGGIHWTKRAAQQLVRYEALFHLLDDIQTVDNIAEIARQAAAQWKYFANVAAWRLVVENDGGHLVIDGARGAAQVATEQALSPWDAYHWERQRPERVSMPEPDYAVAPPEHLAAPAISEIIVLPVVGAGRCIGLLSAAARHEAFSDMDQKFIRIFGGHLTDRISGILLRQKAMQALMDKATYDDLTGLLNRGSVIERLTSALAATRRSGLPLGLIIADIDFFKLINDSYGHGVGDEVLREVARRLQAQTRADDSLGRYGGEEFLAVLYPCTAQELAQAAERLHSAISETAFAIAGEVPGDIVVTISLGTASTAAGADTHTDALIQLADQALYRSKANGRNRVTAARQPDNETIRLK